MTKQGKMVVVSAPSGAGKTTIVKHLLSHPGLRLKFSVSACSRPRRSNEVDGKDYYFMSVDAFRKKITENAFIEWEEVYENHFYGTLMSEVKRIWEEGKTVIFDVDVVGGLNIKKKYPEQTLAIFIMPPSPEHLRERLQKRSTDSVENIQKRVQKSEHEMGFAGRFDVQIVNDNLSEALEKSVAVVNDFLNNS